MVTDAVDVPTIGIGAGPGCDGQVLVFHDVLGIEDRILPKFVRRYADLKAAGVRRAARPSPPTCARGRSPPRPRATTSAPRWPRPSASTVWHPSASEAAWRGDASTIAGCAAPAGGRARARRRRALGLRAPRVRRARRPGARSARRRPTAGAPDRVLLDGFGEIAVRSTPATAPRPLAWCLLAALDAQQRGRGPDGGHRPAGLRGDGLRVPRGRRPTASTCATRRRRCRSPGSPPTARW